MGDFVTATVVFREIVVVGGVVFGAQMDGLAVRREDDWVHVRLTADENTVYSFPVSMIACVAWAPEN
ncbi:hypothetical protein GCM10009760_38200 [Kitasatospora kazusensis]|uniref:Uncharacterized protein n=1 Tax=Kitasatospora kazusensis TaxID=407974 RepID=A0ABP5LKJ5_9ACTN